MRKVSLLYYINEKNYAISAPYGCDIHDFQLLKYAEGIGVMAYHYDETDYTRVEWELQGKWYTTAQIERMLKLKAFL